MDNLSLLVLRQLQAWRSQGHAAMLATVVRTWGSSPRPVGSVMALRGDDGSVVGSVSGGCIEDDLIERYTRVHAAPRPAAPAHADTARLHGLPETLVYGLSADEAHRFGLPCGGTLELVESIGGSTVFAITIPDQPVNLEEARSALRRPA